MLPCDLTRNIFEKCKFRSLQGKNANLGPAGSNPATDLKLDFSQLFLVRSNKNVYKFLLDNFHLQYPSTIIQSSEMPTKS